MSYIFRNTDEVVATLRDQARRADESAAVMTVQRDRHARSTWAHALRHAADLIADAWIESEDGDRRAVRS